MKKRKAESVKERKKGEKEKALRITIQRKRKEMCSVRIHIKRNQRDITVKHRNRGKDRYRKNITISVKIIDREKEMGRERHLYRKVYLWYVY